jgi:hypothetical protein
MSAEMHISDQAGGTVGGNGVIMTSVCKADHLIA